VLTLLFIGGTGIGLMITQALVANGATVYIIGRREETLQTAVDKYGSDGKIIAYVPGFIIKRSAQRRSAEHLTDFVETSPHAKTCCALRERSDKRSRKASTSSSTTAASGWRRIQRRTKTWGRQI
jgi:NAD(P)-dependent dehydrogenase (short-subunit alcohol dehydrogenase family)